MTKLLERFFNTETHRCHMLNSVQHKSSFIGNYETMFQHIHPTTAYINSGSFPQSNEKPTQSATN